MTRSEWRWKWLAASALAVCVVGSVEAAGPTVTVGRDNLVGTDAELRYLRAQITPSQVVGRTTLYLRSLDEPKRVTCAVGQDSYGRIRERVIIDGDLKSTEINYSITSQDRSFSFVATPDMTADYAYSISGLSVVECKIKPL